MKQLWAPWRIEYIQKHEPESGCIFCTKPRERRDEENLIVFRSRYCYILLNLYPYNSGHLMVVPYQHSGSWEEIEAAAGAEMFRASQLATRALEQTMHPEGFNLGVNQSKVAGAGVADHIHLHVVPRWNGDTNFMPVLADAKVIPEHLSATAAKLRPVFAELSSES